MSYIMYGIEYRIPFRITIYLSIEKLWLIEVSFPVPQDTNYLTGLI